MAFNNRRFLAALLLAVAAAELVGNAAAATYVVGDTLGWRVPNSPSDYSNWASRHVFRVGDVLVFNFVTNQHDVAQVTKAAYDGCSSATPILLVMNGPWNVTLNSTGDHYYLCTFSGHCGLGQKLAINVTASSPSPSPSPTPAPAPSPPMAPTPTPSGSPSPTPGSPAPSPGMGSPPSPSPGAGASPPPSPGAPGMTPPSEGLTPPSPPPPSSATTLTIGAPVVGFALAVLGLMI